MKPLRALAAARGDPWRELHDAGVAALDPSVVGEAAQAEEAWEAWVVLDHLMVLIVE